METVIRDSLLSYLGNNNLISDNQHGFRPNRSCVTQLLKVIHDWSQALNKASCVDVIYLDYSKAFDSVPHERLMAKLGSYGIDLKVQWCIRIFLLNRIDSKINKTTKSHQDALELQNDLD